MATTYKNQSTTPDTASTTAYKVLYDTTAGSEVAVISTIAVCNQTASTQTYRIAIDDAGGTSAPAASEFFVYDATVAPNDTIFITVGATLANSRYLKVSGSSTSMSFTAFISEIS
jgi:hypothetical protein